jgi:hypothetical protein
MHAKLRMARPSVSLPEVIETGSATKQGPSDSVLELSRRRYASMHKIFEYTVTVG